MIAITKVLHRGASIKAASSALILLHGRGSSAEDILSLARQLCAESFYIAAPQASNYTWYPYSFLAEEKLNEPFLSLSIKELKALIDQIAEHIPKERLFIAGFSQGACLALELAARFATKYGGIISFTGGLIGETVDPSKYQGSFEGTRVWMSNRTHDPHVPLQRSKDSKILLEKLDAQVALKVYEGYTHTINQDEINSAKEHIINSCLSGD